MAPKTTPKNEVITNRILLVVTLCFALLLGLVFYTRTLNYISADRTRNIFLMNSIIISVASLLLCAALLFYVRAKATGTLKLSRTFSPKWTLGMTILLFLLTLALRLFPSYAISMLYVLIPLLTVGYVVFYTYPRDFFYLFDLLCVWGVVMFALYKVANYVVLGRVFAPLCYVLAAVALLGTLAVFGLHKNNGLLKLAGKRIQIVPSGETYWPWYGLHIAAAISLVAAGIMGVLGAYYGFFVAVAYTVVVTIYYTARAIYTK